MNMKKLILTHNAFANMMLLRFAAHRRKVSGKPLSSGYTFTIMNSITMIESAIWNKATQGSDLFLSHDYLLALENMPPENMKFRYVIISKGSDTIGIAYFQILELNHRLHRPPIQFIKSKRNSLIRNIHNRIADTATFRLLVCGNVLLSGEHGFYMDSIPKENALKIIAEIAWTIRNTVNEHISVTLVKDFYNQSDSAKNILSEFGFYSFDAGPNMVVPIRDNWSTFDKYLADMKSKYRKRATSALKKGSAVQRLQLKLEDMIQLRDELFSLYCQVAGKARFKLFVLSPDFFIELKRLLGERFICQGYFEASRLVGFSTEIINGNIMEGYTHGLDYGSNKVYELYQNFLFDDIKSAIDAKIVQINSGRTSIAMKSSVGAVPQNMTCYMRFSGKISNQFIKPLFFFIKPSDEHCRNPFE